MPLAKPQRIIKATVEQAKKLTAEVRKEWKILETGWLRLGRLVDKCLKDRVPEALGLTAHQWMEKNLPGSTSKAWRALRIVRAFEGVPDEKLAQVSEGNAYALTRLPEKERKSKEWVEKAATESNEVFREDVASCLEKKGVKRDAEFISVSLRMPRPVFDAWEKAIVKAARIFEIDIEEEPNRRIMVYERIAALVAGLQEDTLKKAVEGGE